MRASTSTRNHRPFVVAAVLGVQLAILAPTTASAACTGELVSTEDNCSDFKRYQCPGGTDCYANDCQYGGGECWIAYGSPTYEETCNSMPLVPCAQRTTQSFCDLGNGCSWTGSTPPPPPPSGSGAPPRNSGGAWLYYGGDASADLAGLANRMANLKANGAQYIRLWIPWVEVEPQPGVWDFEKFDRMIATIVAEGFRLEITLSPTMSLEWFWRDYLNASTPVLHRYCEELVEGTTTCQLASARYPKNLKSVGNPHASFWAPDSVTYFIQRYIQQTFTQLLDRWSPFIVFVSPGLGRLNEPTYTNTEHFWSHDYYARANFQAAMQTKYGTVAALNTAWGKGYASFQDVNPPKFPFHQVTKNQHMRDFLLWYRDSKRRWVNRMMGWVKAELHPWQRPIVYVSGTAGDYELLRNTAVTSPRPWKYGSGNWSPNWAVQATMKRGFDNRWILSRATQDGWYVRYGGVGSRSGCANSAVCSSLSDWAFELGYSGPIYSQIPSLGGVDQPLEVCEVTVEEGFYGHHWNKDSNLFGSSTNNQRLASLAAGWQHIRTMLPGDYVPPKISSVSKSAGETSATVTWTTDEPADGAVVFGLQGPQPLMRVAPSPSSYSAAATQSHSITLTGLTQGTTYSFRVLSTDPYGNTTISASTYQVKTTSAPPPSASCQGTLVYQGANCNTFKRYQCGAGTDCDLNDCKYNGSDCFWMCHWQPGGETCEDTCDAKALVPCSQRMSESFCTAGWGCFWQ